MTADASPSPDDVFINCPFDREFGPLLDAIIFTVLACGFKPRTSREIDDSSQSRLDKLYELIDDCRYGIHDLSRTELDQLHGLPHFNMPFELGLFLGAKRFGGEAQKTKRCLILDIEPYRYQKFISDLSGIDPQAHRGDPLSAIRCVRNWLANVSRRKLAGPQLVIEAFKRFERDREAIARDLGFEADQIPYFDFVKLTSDWLLSRSA